MAILTEARQAVWDAIENWPALNGAFKRVWKFEDNQAMQSQVVPTIGDLPALAIYPASTALGWATNQQHSIVYPLGFSLWTRHWNLLTGEKVWQEIVEAIYQSKPDGSNQPYVHSSLRKAMQWGPLTATRMMLADNRNKATLWEWSLNLIIMATVSR